MQNNGANLTPVEPEKQEIHLRDYFAVLKKRQTTVYTFLTITLLLVIIGSYSATPMYTASTEVLVEENIGGSSIEGTSTYRRYDQSFVNTQFKIITSSNVIERVVNQLQLDTKYRRYFFKEKKLEKPNET